MAPGLRRLLAGGSWGLIIRQLTIETWGLRLVMVRWWVGLGSGVGGCRVRYLSAIVGQLVGGAGS